MATTAVVVMDNGTGLTKMGYAGNEAPTYVMPTVVAEPTGGAGVLADLTFHIGHEAMAAHATGGWQLTSPIRRGFVEDWDRMEKLWQRSMYQHLRVEPEEAGILLTESSVNPPENREYAAEVMFETLGAHQLLIAPQSALALSAGAGWDTGDGELRGLEGADTGLVVDCGAGVTTVTPIVDGCVLSHAIQQLPVGGQQMTEFVLERLRARKEPLGAGNALAVAERVKRRHSYVCADWRQECARADGNASHCVVHHDELDHSTGKEGVGFRVAEERFLAAEMLFCPELYGVGWAGSLPEAVDAAIWASPIDCRRPLYKNIVLSGGTALMRGLQERLQAELKGLVDARAQRVAGATKGTAGETALEVNVVVPTDPQFAVFRGGSKLGASPVFAALARTRRQYEEEGPRIMRGGGVFPSL